MGTRANLTAARVLTALLCLFAMLLGTAASCQAEAQKQAPQDSITSPCGPISLQPMEMACCHADHTITQLAACCSAHPQPADQASQHGLAARLTLPSTRVIPTGGKKALAVAGYSTVQISPPPLHPILRI